MKRREFIEISARSIGGLLIYSLAGVPMLAEARTGTLKMPLRFFTKREAEVVSAASERIFPANESGPGATQANVVIYIDRQLGGPYGVDAYRYIQPPFVESAAGHGHQGQENPRQIYRAGIPTLGVDFTELQGPDQDERLKAIQKSYFFTLLRQHTIEGMFCDPVHGGNADLIGWQMLGYPGPQMSYREQIGKYNGVAYRPEPKSLEQILGTSIKPWEDER